MRKSSMKNTIRKTVNRLISEIPSHSLTEKSHTCALSLRQLQIYKTSDKIGLFVNMEKGEIKTLEIIENAFKDGKIVYLPRCYFGNPNRIKFHKLETFEQVQSLTPSGKYNLREPSEQLEECFSDEGLDLLILPGVAFSRNKERLGRGGGFYDEFVERHDKFSKEIGVRMPFLLGIAVREQLVDSLPQEWNDRPVNAVLVEDLLVE